MRLADDVGPRLVESEVLAERPRSGFWDRLHRRRVLVLAILVSAGFAVRAYDLDAAGLAEDETNKMFSIRVYAQGDFTVNADHPMLMKLLCFGSVRAAQQWNDAVGARAGLTLSDESALRLPNAIVGAATAVPLYLLAAQFLGAPVALVATLMWTFGVNTVWVNRIVKEDTLMVFFLLWGFYLFNRAKALAARGSEKAGLLISLSGAAFGLMLASKYFLHLLGFTFLFHHVAGYDGKVNRPIDRRLIVRFFSAVLVAITVLNFSLLLPKTWRYLARYVSEDLLSHHGYPLMGSLYLNDMAQTPGGTPWYFYLLFMAVKLPIPVLALFVVGLVEVFRHRGPPELARGYLFLRFMLVFWIVPMSMVATKFLRYSLSLMPLIYMIAAVGAVVVWKAIAGSLERFLSGRRITSGLATAAVALVAVAVPAGITISQMPFPSLYLNAFGRGQVGYFFPHDEFYDLGARESIRYVARNAPRGSSLASEIPGVVQYYLEELGRPDIRSVIISHPRFDLDRDRPNYVLLQPGRVYFENRAIFERVQGEFEPVQRSNYRGADASRLYSLSPPLDGRAAPHDSNRSAP